MVTRFHFVSTSMLSESNAIMREELCDELTVRETLDVESLFGLSIALRLLFVVTAALFAVGFVSGAFSVLDVIGRGVVVALVAIGLWATERIQNGILCSANLRRMGREESALAG